MYFFKKTIKG